MHEARMLMSFACSDSIGGRQFLINTYILQYYICISHRRWKFIKKRFKEKKRTLFRTRKKERKHAVDQKK